MANAIQEAFREAENHRQALLQLETLDVMLAITRDDRTRMVENKEIDPNFKFTELQRIADIEELLISRKKAKEEAIL